MAALPLTHERETRQPFRRSISSCERWTPRPTRRDGCAASTRFTRWTLPARYLSSVRRSQSADSAIANAAVYEILDASAKTSTKDSCSRSSSTTTGTRWPMPVIWRCHTYELSKPRARDVLATKKPTQAVLDRVMASYGNGSASLRAAFWRVVVCPDDPSVDERAALAVASAGEAQVGAIGNYVWACSSFCGISFWHDGHPRVSSAAPFFRIERSARGRHTVRSLLHRRSPPRGGRPAEHRSGGQLAARSAPALVLGVRSRSERRRVVAPTVPSGRSASVLRVCRRALSVFGGAVVACLSWLDGTEGR